MLALTGKLGRQTAHEVLRVHAGADDFVAAMQADPRVAGALSAKELADLLMSQGKADAALLHYLASADINPFDSVVQHSLATLYGAAGNVEQAERRRRYERILRLGGSSSPQGSSR